MRLLIFVFLISVCYAFDFNCLKGPNFWCATFKNAEKCGKITECFMDKKNSNKENKLPNVNTKSETCNTCIQFVRVVESKMPKLTEKEFINLIDTFICDRIQANIQWRCRDFVAEFGPVIYEEIKTEATPEKICGLIQACENHKEMSFMKIFNKIPNNNELCAKCKEIFDFLDTMFSKVTPDEFKYLLETLVCSQLPSEFRDTCKALLDGYVTQLYYLIKSLLDGDRICPLFHFCPSNTTVTLNSWNCQTCLDVVAMLKKDMVNVPASEVEALIKNNVCSKMNFVAKPVCNEYVDNYVPKFMGEIQSSMTPQQICNTNHFCMVPSIPKPTVDVKGPVTCNLCEIAISEMKSFISNTENIEKLKIIVKTDICSHFKSLSSECSSVVDRYGDILMTFVINHMDAKTICKLIHACTSVHVQLKPVQKMKGIECEACRLVVKKFKEYISDPSTETEIKNFLKNKFCYIFGSDKIQCQQIIDEYFNIILNFILAEVDVDKICKFVGLCNVKLSGIECELCERVMDEVIKVVTSNHSEQVVANFITLKICPRLSVIKTECINITNAYLPVIFSIARSTLNSKVICAELKLCTLLSKQKISFLMNKSGNETVKCEICKFAILEIRTLLTNPDFQKIFENFLINEICPHFKTKQQQCTNDINQYYSLVVNIIVEFLNPSLCTELGLCNSTIKQVIMRQPLVQINRSKKTSHCRLCCKFYNYLQTISSKSSHSDLLFGLVSFCNQINAHEKLECLKQFRNFNAVIAAFNKSKNINEFCEMTKMCSHQRKNPLGKNPCTWGPGFWCISRKHAVACGPGAVKHCEMNMWRQMPII